MTERERKTAYAWNHIKQAGSALAKRGDALLPGYRELKKMGVVSIEGAHVQLAGDYRRAFLAGEEMPSWADLSSVTKAPTKEAYSKKKSPAQLQREIDEVLARSVNGDTVERGIAQIVDGPPDAGWTKFHKRVHGYPISFYKAPHGQYEMLRRPSDFLVKYAAAVGDIGKIEPIEKIGVYPTVDEALSAVAGHDRMRR